MGQSGEAFAPAQVEESCVAAVGRNKAMLGVGAVVLAAGTLVAFLVGSRPERVTGDTPQERIQSICRLADERPRGAADAIAAAVNDPDAQVRRAAVMALGQFTRPKDRAAIDAAAGNADRAIGAAGARALGRYADAPAIDRLITMLRADASAEVRIESARALAATRQRRALEAVVDAMKRSELPAVQRAAFVALLRLQHCDCNNVPDPSNRAAWEQACEQVRIMTLVPKPPRDASAKGATP
jgi:HEAT repeat protein